MNQPTDGRTEQQILSHIELLSKLKTSRSAENHYDHEDKIQPGGITPTYRSPSTSVAALSFNWVYISTKSHDIHIVI